MNTDLAYQYKLNSTNLFSYIESVLFFITEIFRILKPSTLKLIISILDRFN